MNQPRHWRGCSMERLKRKENQRRPAHKRFRPVFWRVEELNENCPSQWLLALILRRLSEAAIGEKIKWQTQKNWWSNSATCRCWRLLDWLSSLRKNGG